MTMTLEDRQTDLITPEQIDAFKRDGYASLSGILSPDEIDRYRKLYDRFLSGDIRLGGLRSDLGGHEDKKKAGVENVTHVMWPSVLVPILIDGPAHQRCRKTARAIYGDDMDFDFDMMINKSAHTNTPTPWHQDAAYWPPLPDLRAASFWIALDEATVDNGCMWFVPGSHAKPLRRHRNAGSGSGALVCDATESEGVAVPLHPGECTIHHGCMLHYTRGNSTNTNRRALIVNLRPKSMIELERKQGFDHGLTARQQQR